MIGYLEIYNSDLDYFGMKVFSEAISGPFLFSYLEKLVLWLLRFEETFGDHLLS